jgi:hypothetical protein
LVRASQTVRQVGCTFTVLAASTGLVLSSGNVAAAASSVRVNSGATWAAPAALGPGLLVAVSAAPMTPTAWAVGNAAGFQACYGGYVLRYNGKSWNRMRSGLPADVALNGVAAVSAKKAWVVGGIYPKKFCSAPSRPFLASSTGGSFRARRLKKFSLGNAVLEGISAPSAHDVWVVGRTESKGASSPLVLRFNGKSWKRMPMPSALAKNEVPSSVSASSPGNAWIVATNSATDASELLHWDGTAWASYPAPANDQLLSVATSSAGQAWVVGYTQTDAYSAHWNGATWTSVHVPKATRLLFGVTMSGSGAWAAGEKSVGESGRSVPAILSWAKGQWRPQAVPDPSESKSGVNQSALMAVSAASRHFVVGVGQNGIQCGTGSGSFADVDKGHGWQAAPDMARPGQGGPAVPDCGG